MTKKKTLQAQLHQKLQKNNKGSSLVTVLLVASIIAALVTVVLAIVLLNVYMKKADLEGQGAFYDAETALEEVREGLAKAESDATTYAYLDTLSNYANLNDKKSTGDDDDEKKLDEKTKHFNELFRDDIQKRIALAGTNDYYDPVKLKDFLKETQMIDGVGAEIVTDTSDAHFNSTKEGAVLKNVQVRYTDKDKYVSEIKTDIVLEYPPIDFQNASSIDNILTYALIANKTFEPGTPVHITGNAYIGSEGSEINSANVYFNANGTQETNVICGGDIKLKGSTLTTNNIALWSDSILLDTSSTYNMNKGSSYIKNDLVLGNNSFATLVGKFIMFGNPWVAKDKDMITAKKINQLAEEDPPSYSSSILVTGHDAGLDMSKLDTMVIGGSAYVDTQSKNGENGISGNSNTVTGQSLALKSDQRAYLVPPTLVGVNETYENGKIRTSNYSNGLSNPMTGSQFQKLTKEIADEKYNGDVTQVKKTDYVAMNTAEPTLGISLNGFVNAIWEQAHEGIAHNQLDAKYYPDVNISYYPAPKGGGSIVYMFIEFKTIGKNYVGQQNADYIPAEAQYNTWYKLYNSSIVNYSKLLSNLNNYYATKGIKLPDDVGDKTKMYFTGNILSTDLNNVIVPDSITRPDFTMDLNVEYSKQSAYYQDAYYMLNKNLTTRYDASAENKTLFKNLIDTEPIVQGKSYTLGGTYYYVSPTGEAAVVTNSPYTYDSTSDNSVANTKDIYGNKHSDAKINVIISTGNVKVASNFEGMIIAGGKVEVEGDVKVKANSDKASKALIATNYEDINDCAANYVINAAKYLLGGTGNKDADSGQISMKNYVTYRNWIKQ